MKQARDFIVFIGDQWVKNIHINHYHERQVSLLLFFLQTHTCVAREIMPLSTTPGTGCIHTHHCPYCWRLIVTSTMTFHARDATHVHIRDHFCLLPPPPLFFSTPPSLRIPPPPISPPPTPPPPLTPPSTTKVCCKHSQALKKFKHIWVSLNPTSVKRRKRRWWRWRRGRRGRRRRWRAKRLLLVIRLQLFFLILFWFPSLLLTNKQI